MRSRNGNNTSSFSAFISICLCFLYSSASLLADEYFISYRYSTHNAALSYEELYISKAMTKCQGTPTSQKLLLENNTSAPFQFLIKKNSEQFIDYLHKIGMHITYTNTTHNNKSQTSTRLTFQTRCFKVDFNDNFVTIAPLK